MKKLPLFPTLGKVLKKSFVEAYQSIGFTFLISLIWQIGYLLMIFAASPILMINSQKSNGGSVVLGMLAVTAVNALLLGPLTATLYGFYQQRKEGYPTFKTFINIFKTVYLRAAGINGLLWIANTLFVFNIVTAVPSQNLLLKISGLFSLYCLLFGAMMPFFFHPLIYLGYGIKKTIQKTFILILDNFGLSFWLNLFLGVLLVVSTLFLFLLFLYGGLMIYVLDSGFGAIWDKYDEPQATE